MTLNKTVELVVYKKSKMEEKLDTYIKSKRKIKKIEMFIPLFGMLVAVPYFAETVSRL